MRCRATTLITTALLFLCTCAPRSLRRIDLLSVHISRGEYDKALSVIQNDDNLYGTRNSLLFHFDQGLLYHYRNDFDSSIFHLHQAQTIADDLYTRSITNEAASLVTNDNIRPYRGRRYEIILLHQFLMFNYAAQGRLDEALVESRKLNLVVDAFASQDRDTSRYSDNGMARYFSALLYNAQGESDNAAISLFKAVRAYRSGPLPLPEAVQNTAYYSLVEADRPDDIALLELSPTVPKEYAALPQKHESELICISHLGRSPVLGERVFWGTYVVDGMLILHYRDPSTQEMVTIPMQAPPLPESQSEKNKGEKTASGTTFHIKFSVPVPIHRESRAYDFTLQHNDSLLPQPAVSLLNTDLLLDKDIEDNRMTTLARTALRVVLRTIAAQKAKQAMQTSSPAANLLVNIGTDIASSQLEKADTRLCFLLPREIGIFRIPIEPGSHRLEAVVRDVNGQPVSTTTWDEITVLPGEKKFVFFASLE